jgi:membrane protein implicated in regulation of membrane protease activity
MAPALIWLVVGLLLVAAEVLSGDFVLLMFGGGALAAAAASVLGLGLAGGAAVFAVASVLLLFALRPVLRRRLHRSTPHTPTRAESLIGGTATVVARVDGRGGRVRIGDDEWSARAFDEAQVMDVGARVTVVRIAGATALVLAEY